jgi:hypothetical protein
MLWLEAEMLFIPSVKFCGIFGLEENSAETGYTFHGIFRWV